MKSQTLPERLQASGNIGQLCRPGPSTVHQASLQHSAGGAAWPQSASRCHQQGADTKRRSASAKSLTISLSFYALFYAGIV